MENELSRLPIEKRVQQRRDDRITPQDLSELRNITEILLEILKALKKPS